MQSTPVFVPNVARGAASLNLEQAQGGAVVHCAGGESMPAGVRDLTPTSRR